ncbi:MAG: molybdopterin molybdotransferase MoeA [Planctomycetota bacterium]
MSQATPGKTSAGGVQAGLAGGRRSASVLPAMASPAEAIEAMRECVRSVPSETVPVDRAAGRVLVDAIRADRDSPAADVSAMDGYAVRIGELAAAVERGDELPVAFEVETGCVPPALPRDRGARVFTGGVVPEGADAVVRREDTAESPTSLRWRGDALPEAGANIRRRGENATRGDVLVAPGCVVGSPEMAVLSSVSVSTLSVARRVRVTIIVTGNEVAPPADDNAAEADAPGRPRNSNGPMLATLFGQAAWCGVVANLHVPDDGDATAEAIARAASDADAVVTTGGVSMGDHDHVPAALASLGAEIVYHHLAMRPGKPNLGAILPSGVPVIGLPGNPVSVAVGGVVLVGPILRGLAGLTRARHRAVVSTDGEPDAQPTRPLPLWHYPLVRVDPAGTARRLPSRGSGDVPSLGRCDGFVELPPGQTIESNRCRWFGWSID